MDVNQIAKQVGAVAIALLIGAGFGRYSLPAKVVTKTETVTVEKEVIKNTEKTIKDTNKDRELIIIETIKPDGTKVVEKHYVNRDQIKEDTTKVNVTTDIKKTDEKTSTVVSNGKNDWNLSALVTTSHTEDDMLKGNVSYGVHVQRRILGPMSIGAFGLTNKTYGISLGVSF
jgi:lipopolysaccharide export LptBFGC system permease protein LptF